jgi:hypothetical protein
MNGPQGTPEPTASPAGRGRRRAIVASLLVLTVIVAGAAYRLAPRGAAGADEGEPGSRATATVTRATISDTRAFAGTLGHGEPFTVLASTAGVVTGIAEQGTTVTPGTELLRVNERPVVALGGSVPMYRDLHPGDVGTDVAQLISNLRAFGHAHCDDEDEFTGCVEEAVREWQETLGLPVTGTVARGDVVFVPEDGRVGALHARVGNSVTPGAAVLDLTGFDQVVGLEVELRHRDLLPVGREVEVRLPGGATVVAVVSAARVVSAETGMGGSGSGDVVRVDVTLGDPVDNAFLGAVVDVLVEVDTRVDVLTVPVNALLALTGGGHGLEVVDADGGTTVVPVVTGLFARGLVEVSGEGIDEGAVVVVAGR